MKRGRESTFWVIFTSYSYNLFLMAKFWSYKKMFHPFNSKINSHLSYIHSSLYLTYTFLPLFLPFLSSSFCSSKSRASEFIHLLFSSCFNLSSIRLSCIFFQPHLLLSIGKHWKVGREKINLWNVRMKNDGNKWGKREVMSCLAKNL